MRRTLLISALLHVLGLATLWRWDGVTPPAAPGEQLAEVEVLLSDPTRGRTLAEEPAADAAMESKPEPATEAAPPAAQSAAPPSMPEAPRAEPVAPAPPVPESSPVEDAVLPSPPPPPAPEPQPPSQPPRAAAPRPAPPRPAAPRPAPAVRIGASDSGRDDGKTDIVIGENVVEAAVDTGNANLPPRYPPEAARRGQQGHVVMQVLVGTDGNAISVEVTGGSGFPLLDRAAREAVAKWRFRPSVRDGLAVPGSVNVVFSFRLEDRQ